jgi:hypothetical protein
MLENAHVCSTEARGRIAHQVVRRRARAFDLALTLGPHAIAEQRDAPLGARSPSGALHLTADGTRLSMVRAVVPTAAVTEIARLCLVAHFCDLVLTTSPRE